HSGLVLEADVLKCKRLKFSNHRRPLGARLLRGIENGLEIVQGYFRLAVNVNDVAELLERPENEEGIDPQRKELPERDLLRVNEIQHESQNRRPEEVDRSALDKAEAPEIADFLQLELQDFLGCRVESPGFLLREAQALDEFDIPERFRRGPG